MEAIYAIRNDPNLTQVLDEIVLISPSGYLPAGTLCGREPAFTARHLETLVERHDVSAHAILNAAAADAEFGRRLGYTSLDYSGPICRAFSEVFVRLSFEERRRFVEEYGGQFTALNRHSPPEYAAAAEFFHQGGRLRLVCARVTAVERKIWMKYKHLALGFLAIFVLTGSLWARTCKITSDKTPPAVNAGGTHIFTASCPNPVWTVSGPGSINSSTGVYSAPATVWAQDVSRGWQLLPNDNAYKLPINRLPVDSRSSYWLQRVADDHPSIAFYHNFKLDQPGVLGFYDNVVNNSVPDPSGALLPWRAIPGHALSHPLPPNVSMQNGWSQDVAADLDRHIFSINTQTGDDTEVYNFYVDYRTIAISAGNPTSIAYTTHSIRALQNPIRVYVSGITGGCSILNGTYMATVVSQTPGVGGTLSVPVNTTGLACSSGKPVMASSTAKCNLCNSAAGHHWFPYSNAITGGTDAAGSPISAYVGSHGGMVECYPAGNSRSRV